MKDYFKIKIPNYTVSFLAGVDYSYETKGKENLKKVLLESSKGYCMYCYRKLEIDEDVNCHLEHTIEQDTIKLLTDCHYNLSITCPKCNLSRKKLEQKERKIIPKTNLSCNKDLCISEPCDDFFKIANEYIQNMIDKDLGKIILRPRGIRENSVLGNYYLIEFDLFEYQFFPDSGLNYSDNSINYIKSHIIKFDLNNPKIITKEIKKVIEDILDTHKIPKSSRYNNYTAELFIELLNKMKKYKSIDEIENFCADIADNLLLKGII